MAGDWLSMPPLMQMYQNQGIQDQLKAAEAQQRVQQMVEEMRLKAQMQPVDIDYKSAMTDYNKALAEKMRREPQETNAQRLAQAKMLEAIERRRQTQGRLQSVLAAQQSDPEGTSFSGPDAISRLIQEGKIDPEAIDRLQPAGSKMFTNDVIQGIISDYQKRDPDYNKRDASDSRLEGTKYSADQRLEGVKLMAAARDRATSAKSEASGATSKPAKSLNEQANKYYDQGLALAESNPSQAEVYFKIADDFYRKAKEEKAVSAEAAAANKMDMSQYGVKENKAPAAPTPAVRPNQPAATPNRDALKKALAGN